MVTARPASIAIGAQRRSAGFTLIELLVVMALIALLLTLSLPRYFSNVDKARESVLRQDLASLRDAIDKHFGDVERYPDALDDLVTKKYLRRIPIDPMTDRTDTWVIVPPDDPDLGGVFDVKSGAQGNARDGTAYAQW
jgi:general secretion pathway protein G